MSPKIGSVQIMTAKRYGKLRGEIKNTIDNGIYYPWALLARLQAHKFYSDIVESLIGALWIDSGSFDTCEELIERMVKNFNSLSPGTCCSIFYSSRVPRLTPCN